MPTESLTTDQHYPDRPGRIRHRYRCTCGRPRCATLRAQEMRRLAAYATLTVLLALAVMHGGSR